MKQLYRITVFLLLLSCGKRFESPNPNRFLGAVVTASPLTVASDSLVTINGKGFSANPDADQVFFNGVGAAIVQASPTQLVVKVPATGSTGAITVRVSGEQADGPVFTYPTSSLFSISPANGIGGTTVTLRTAVRIGAAASTKVSFGNLEGNVQYTDSSRIIVIVPDSVKTSQLTITTNGQQYAGPVFTLTTISFITPALQGAGGGTISIIGTGFDPIPANNSVNFPTATVAGGTGGSTLVPVVRGNADTLVVNVPANAVTGPISVSPNGQNTITGPVFTLFSINQPHPDSFPFVSSSGFPQLLTGSGFSPILSQNHLTVNGLTCNVTYVSPTGDTLLFYPPDLINPPRRGLAYGPIVLQSGVLTATATYYQYNNNIPLPSSYIYEEVSTLAGGSFGLADGTGKNAQFETLSGIALNNQLLYVTDRQANNIRQITSDGVVSLIAGSSTGQAGYKDGIGAAALFNAPSGLAVDNAGNLIVADSGNFRIRYINLSTYQVTTLSGSGVQGTADGAAAAAQYLGPNSITADCCGTGFYLTDAAGGQGSIRHLSSDGLGTVATTTTGLSNPTAVFEYPQYGFSVGGGLSYFDNQSLYIPAAGGIITGSAGSAGIAVNYPSSTSGVYTYNFLVSDRDNNVIRLVDLSSFPNGPSYPVSTFIGGMGGTTAGYQDGGFRTALFNKPGPMVITSSNYFGNVTYITYVCDVGNHAIRVFN